MTIDTILNHKPASSDVSKALEMVFAVSEAIREAGEVPSGTLYAFLMGRVSLEGYNKIIGILKGAGLIKESNHLLAWTGPILEGK